MRLKILTAGFAALAVLCSSALAASFGSVPVNYKSDVQSYVTDRLAVPQAARFQFRGDPYQVFASIGGYDNVPCWAVDVRVRARLADGSQGGFIAYTVLFLDGKAVALEEDVRRVMPL